MKISPPKRALAFLRWFCRVDYLEEIEGDLFEVFEKQSEISKGKANRQFAWSVLKYFRPGFIKTFRNFYQPTTLGMYQNYFKIGWRNLLKNKGYSAINIGGLALGMAVAILIGFWIYDEMTFNKYNDNYENIAQVYRKEFWNGENMANATQVTGLGTLLKNEYGAHFRDVIMMRGRAEERVIATTEKKFTQAGYFMQAGGAEMLDLEMLSGTHSGLQDINSILLSESLANKLFGDLNVVNKVVKMDAKWDLKVTGVYKDLPRNSTFYEGSYFAPLDRFFGNPGSLNIWNNYNISIYVFLHSGVNIKKLSSVIKDCSLPHLSEERVNSKPEIFLHPMKDWHLRSEFENGVLTSSKKLMSVWYYGVIGLIVLLLACINFMNLSTALAGMRAKEVGIRKSIGSLRRQLMQQFYVESFLVALIAFLLSALLVFLSLPWFNSVADKNLEIPWTNIPFWLGCLGFVTFTGLIAGSYPAIYLSAFKPVTVLKGAFRSGRSTVAPRKVLVVFQLTVSVILTIGTVIVYQQIQFAKNRPVGYSRENLIGLRAASPEYRGKYMTLRNELKKTGAVTEIAEANYAVTDTRGSNRGFSWRDKEYKHAFNTIYVSHEYGKTVGWDFISGRDFSRDFASDSTGIVINESAMKILGIENPIGEYLTWTRENELPGHYKIIGVVKDMVKGSPYAPTDPSINFLSNNDMQWLYIRLNPQASLHAGISKIERVFSLLVPSAPFDFSFADEAYESKFSEEIRVGKLASVFSALAIFISCLGLFGLAAFSADQRTKEIGIRKVLGASVTNLWQLLAKDFVLLTIVSCFIAVPLAYYFMSNWLQQYQYRTVISWKIFLAACLGGMLITLLTVSFHSVKAALMKPVKSLKAE